MKVIDKPVEYTAVLFDGDNIEELSEHTVLMVKYVNGNRKKHVTIISDGRTVFVDPGKWVVVDQFGSAEVYTDVEFRQRYKQTDG